MSYLDPNIRTSGTAGPPAQVSPQAGMQFPVVAHADPTGKITVGCATLLALPQAAYTATIPAACTFSTTYITQMAVDINVVSFTGGTSPSVTFQLSRLAADGNYYGILAPAGSNISGNAPYTFSAAGTASIDVGAWAQDNNAKPNTTSFIGSAHNVFTSTTLFNWSFTGAPTSVTFSVSIIGR